MTSGAVAGGGPHLRDADWRFLLPRLESFEFGHLIVSGGPAGLEARLIDLGVACSVSPWPVPDPPADAVALLPDSPVDPVDALGWLPSGKPLYVEIDRFAGSRRDRIGLTPRRLAGRLQSAGATIEAVYLIAGDPTGSKRYIQLGLPETFGWYVRDMISGSTRSQSAIQQLAGHLPDVVWRLAWRFAPRFAIVAMRHPAGPSASSRPGIPGLSDGCARRDASIVQITSGVDDGSRIVTLGIPAGAREPQWVRKTARQASFNDHIEAEHRALVTLHQRLQPVTRRAVPRSLGIERAGSLLSGTETAAPGARILDLAWRRDRPAREKKTDLELATSWLIDAHRQLQVPNQVEALAWLSEALEFSADQAARYALSRRAQRSVDLARADLARIAEFDMPLTVRHGDFGPWNVLRRGHDLAVIDWENCRPDDPAAVGPGLCDLLHLAMHWSFAARGLHTAREQAEGLRDLVSGSPRNEFAVAARREISRYMRELSVDGCLLGPLLVLTLLDHAVERERRENATSRIGVPAAENRFLTLLDVLESPAIRLVHW